MDEFSGSDTELKLRFYCLKKFVGMMVIVFFYILRKIQIVGVMTIFFVLGGSIVGCT